MITPQIVRIIACNKQPIIQYKGFEHSSICDVVEAKSAVQYDSIQSWKAPWVSFLRLFATARETMDQTYVIKK